jgi:RNA polymerase sigma-70 factor, ECF subfamily
MKVVAGATTLAELASALGQGAQEASIVAELKAGSEQAYFWLIAHYHQPVYSLVFRMVNDPADAADTTQEVFLKVFRGMGHFNGHASLKTWIYRIAVHEAANRKRWWFRHKRRETSLEPVSAALDGSSPGLGLKDVLTDPGESPFDTRFHQEIRAKVEQELRQVPEPFRTAVILRDIEELSYEEIAEVMQVSLGTVKSRLMRGRDALKKRLQPFAAILSSEVSSQHDEASHPAPASGKKPASPIRITDGNGIAHANGNGNGHSHANSNGIAHANGHSHDNRTEHAPARARSAEATS